MNFRADGAVVDGEGGVSFSDFVESGAELRKSTSEINTMIYIYIYYYKMISL